VSKISIGRYLNCQKRFAAGKDFEFGFVAKPTNFGLGQELRLQYTLRLKGWIADLLRKRHHTEER
jgi:hypothetical protein